MKNSKKRLLIILLSIFLTGCTQSLTEISYEELQQLKSEKETFILEVMQDGCPHCEEFSPKLKNIVKKYKLKNVYQLNLSKLKEKESITLLEEINVKSTPTTLFYKNGKELGELYRIEGAVSDKLVINKLQELKYIK